MFTIIRLRRASAVLLISLLIPLRLLAGGAAEDADQASATDPSRTGQELIQETIEHLAAPELAGRLTGSPGNRQAAEFLAGRLRELGLEPLVGADSLLEAYTQSVLRREAPAQLVIRAGADGPMELEPGRDFQILIRHGATIGGSIETTVVTPPEELNAGWIAAHRDHALLLDAETFAGLSEDRELMGRLFSPQSGPAAVLLGTPAQAKEMPRGVFLTHEEYPAGGPMLVQITAEVAEELRALGEPRIEISSSYRVESAEAANVVAQLPVGRGGASAGGQAAGGGAGGGGSTDAPILLTAHFDGQGGTGAGVYYPGAVDNASGVATVIAAARLLAEDPPADSGRRRPIWIVLFNGEEQGLYGSEAFAAAHESDLAGATVVNIDMIGHSEEAAFSVVSTSAGRQIAAEVAERLEAAGFTANHGGQGRSDHLSFRGTAAAVTLVQAPYPSMHAPGDVAARADAAMLERVAEALATYVREETR